MKKEQKKEMWTNHACYGKTYTLLDVNAPVRLLAIINDYEDRIATLEECIANLERTCDHAMGHWMSNEEYLEQKKLDDEDYANEVIKYNNLEVK